MTVPTGAFEDLAGNDFTGITDPAALNFTTVGAGNVVGGITILDEAASLQGQAGAAPTGSNALHMSRIGSYDSGNGAGGAESRLVRSRPPTARLSPTPRATASILSTCQIHTKPEKIAPDRPRSP